jgi:hypothetical protein
MRRERRRTSVSASRQCHHPGEACRDTGRGSRISLRRDTCDRRRPRRTFRSSRRTPSCPTSPRRHRSSVVVLRPRRIARTWSEIEDRTHCRRPRSCSIRKPSSRRNSSSPDRRRSPCTDRSAGAFLRGRSTRMDLTTGHTAIRRCTLRPALPHLHRVRRSHPAPIRRCPCCPNRRRFPRFLFRSSCHKTTRRRPGWPPIRARRSGFVESRTASVCTHGARTNAATGL